MYIFQDFATLNKIPENRELSGLLELRNLFEHGSE